MTDPLGAGGDSGRALLSGILLMGAIALFIAWGLAHAYSG